jgi:hypothetical protein
MLLFCFLKPSPGDVPAAGAAADDQVAKKKDDEISGLSAGSCFDFNKFHSYMYVMWHR